MLLMTFLFDILNTSFDIIKTYKTVRYVENVLNFQLMFHNIENKNSKSHLYSTDFWQIISNLRIDLMTDIFAEIYLHLILSLRDWVLGQWSTKIFLLSLLFLLLYTKPALLGHILRGKRPCVFVTERNRWNLSYVLRVRSSFLSDHKLR